MRECLSQTGKLGLRLLDDLTALAAGGSVCVELINLEFLAIYTSDGLQSFTQHHPFISPCPI